MEVDSSEERKGESTSSIFGQFVHQLFFYILAVVVPDNLIPGLLLDQTKDKPDEIMLCGGHLRCFELFFEDNLALADDSVGQIMAFLMSAVTMEILFER